MAGLAETKAPCEASYSPKMKNTLRNMIRSKTLPLFLSLATLAAPASAFGQSPSAQPPQPPDDPMLRVTVPTVTVSAQKEPEDIQKIPVSVTAVSAETIEQAGIRVVSDAAIYAPNAFFTEFTARKLSNARFRGIGASPNNPAITTFIDGVPQLNANSSSIDLLDVQQIEFVRGPQSALFGRNTLGGLVNVISGRPAFAKWNGRLQLPFGNFSSFDLRGNASGTLVPDTLSASVAFSVARRDGFTVDDVTGEDIDSRGAFSGKGQLLWLPARDWEARVIVTGERARDGDYALNDLAALRENPFQSSRDFAGHTHRDLLGATIQTTRKGSAFVLSATTGLLKWTTEDATDLDYSAQPLITRDNAEEDFQFTQEVRVASVAPRKLSDTAVLKWQSGVFLFTQSYQQDAVNHIAPFVFSTMVPSSVDQYSPVAELDDFGLGVFGQGTVTVNERLDIIAGARLDYESKNADLKTFFDPAVLPPTVVVAEDSFTNVSPQFAVAYRVRPEHNVYGTVARGFKAGGFNPASPAGSESYGEEESWHLEGGVKSRLMDGRVAASAAVFFIDWNDLQLNVPNLSVPGQIYVANVGGASSKGFELEATARPAPGVDVFGAFGYTNARFSNGSTSLGQDVSDNKIPNTPDYTGSIGAQYSRVINPAWTGYGRAELVFTGAFKYDDANIEGQQAYTLTNLRGGVRGRRFYVEGWLKNAFDIHYIPVAFAYGELVPSGFIGENGAPRTFGVRVGVTF
jgi:iron complex outermembrane recepter protein